MTTLSLIKARLSDKGTYVIVFVVGTIINLYGQVFVPWLRGEQDPLIIVYTQFAQAPWVFAISVVSGYVFPLFVTILSSVRLALRLRGQLEKADFPDRKPAPVFRCMIDEDGTIITAGELTARLFQQHDITSASQLLGRSNWKCVHESAASGFVPSVAKLISVPVIAKDCLASWTPGPNGTVNIYLSYVAFEDRSPLFAGMRAA